MNYKLIKQYDNDGFYIARSVLSKDLIKELIDYLETLDTKVKVPFTDIVFGYGNLLSKGPFNEVTENELIVEFCKSIIGDDFLFNHLFVHNKVPWIGPGIEWHQEVFNIDSFAPGYSKDEWKNFMQVYVALETQDIDNGCLRVFPSSHKEGILSHEDSINEHLQHKRRVKFETLEMLYEKYGVKHCELEMGDVLIFNHLLVHGSSSNTSNKSRKSIVSQVRKDIREKNHNIFNKESEYRKNFVTKSLNDKIEYINKSDLYGEQGKKD